MLDTKNGSIDLDELVNSLIQDKKASAPAAPSEKKETALPEEESVEVSATVSAAEPTEEPASVEAVTPPTVGGDPAMSALAESLLTDETAVPSAKTRRGLFGWLKRRELEDEPLEEEWADWGLKPIGQYHTAEPVVEDQPVVVEELIEEPAEEIEDDLLEEPETAPASPVEPVTMVMPAVEPPADKDPALAATMVMPAVGESAETVSSAVESDIEEKPESVAMPDQVSLEELVRVEDIEDAPVEPSDDGEDIEERLKRAREEKVREFVLGGEEEEENEPEEEDVSEADETELELEDFVGYDTTDAVRLELQYRWRTGLVGTLLTGGLELLLVLLTMLTISLGQSPITTVGYLTVHAFCLILMAVLNYSAVSRGLSGLFMLRANNDTAPAVAMAVSLCGVIAHFVNMDMPLPVFAPLAGLLMVFNAVGQQVKLARIRENFAFVSYRGEKHAAALVDDTKTVAEFTRHMAAEKPVNVAYFRRTEFLSGYLNNAYEEDGGDRFAAVATPIMMGLSLVASLAMLAAGMLHGFWAWLSTFGFMLCLSAFSLLSPMQLLMRRACRRMLGRGGFLVGWNAVDSFGRPDALVVDVADLFPDECMLLHGIKTFSGMHIDAAILDAASLSIRAGGPLSMIFRRIIENKEELLREVDTLAYEQGMGLSGWVDGRRVLVGNRRLLQNHDVDVPSLDYEARYAKNGRQLVYLSTSGVLSAMFVVSYLPDEAIGESLRGLCRSHVSLLVRSNDANVTAEMLCDAFGLDEYYVDVLPAAAGRMYDRLVATEVAEVSAQMASNGHVLGTSLVLAACRSLRIQSVMAMLVQVLTALVGLGLCALWATGAVGSYFLPAVAYMLVAGVVNWLVPRLKR